MRRNSVHHRRSESRDGRRSALGRAAIEALECRTLLADVSGFVYQDANTNGVRDAGELGFGLRPVYADLNDNGAADSNEPFAYSNYADGSFTLSGLADGTYRIRSSVPLQYRQTEPQTGGAQVVTVTGGANVTGVNFGLAPTVIGGGSVQGTLYQDSNADGNLSGEQPLPSAKVYADLNGNGALDVDEPYALPNVAGDYKLLLLPGHYAIRAQFPAGYLQSAPASAGGYEIDIRAGLTSLGYSFGGYTTAPLIAYAFNDVNGDGVRAATDPYLSGRTFYLDANNNGVLDSGETTAVTGTEGRVQFDLYPGTYTVRQVLPTGWSQTVPAAGGGWTETIASGYRNFAKDFGSRVTSGTISGVAFNDADGNGVRGAGEAGLPNLVAWIDANNNGDLDTGERATTTDVAGRYTFDNVPLGSYTFRIGPPTGYQQTTPIPPKPGSAVLTATAPSATQDFGFRLPPSGAVTTSVFNDNDADGKFGPGDTARADARVFVDANHNGFWDIGETYATSDANGNVTFPSLPTGLVTLRVSVPAGFAATTLSGVNGTSVNVVAGQTTAATAFALVNRDTVTAVTGVVFEDTDADGIRDADEFTRFNPVVYVDANNNAQLDAGERTPLILSLGSGYTYQFLLPAAGQYTIRQVPPTGWRQTWPANNAGRVVSFGFVGGTLGGMDFGITQSILPPPPTTGTIRGTVFQDLDADGVRDAGESGITVSRWMFLDTNGNRTYDVGEPTTYTGTDGTYSFTGLQPGTYMVGQDGSFTTFQTSPTTLAGATVSVLAGGDARVDFGDNPDGNIVIGKVFVDANANGYHDAAETLLAGRTVYADLNNNNVRDAAEPYVTTEQLPAGYNGWQFRMRLPGPGTYVLRQILPAGWEQTTPAGTGGITMTLGVNEGRTVFFASRQQQQVPGYPGTPFSGTPIPIASTGTTTLQVENYDNGGEGVAYHDLDAANVGGNTAYRTGGVDLSTTTDGATATVLSFAKAGEWLKYSVDVAQAGAYNVGFRVASLRTGGSMHLEVDGVKVGGSITVPDTTSWTTWKTITLGNVQLPAGRHVLTLKFDTQSSIGYVGNFNYLTFTPATVTPPTTTYTGTPYKGTPAKVNASGSSTIELENFDDGGEGVAYHDTDTANLGKTTYRTGGVDVEAISDGSAGLGVGFVKAGEWLKYTVDVAADGTYALDVRLASLSGGGAFHFEVDGVRLTPNLTVPRTGAWTTYSTLRQTGVALKAGRHVVRLVMDANGSTGYVANFNWMRFTRT